MEVARLPFQGRDGNHLHGDGFVNGRAGNFSPVGQESKQTIACQGGPRGAGMTEHVGTLLWELRTAGGWTQGKLAQRAGVSKATLSQWESGSRQPCVPELEAVLDALEASAA